MMRWATPAGRQQRAIAQAADQIADEHPGPVGDQSAEADAATDQRQRHQGKTAGDQFEAEDHDHHEAGGEDQRPDQRLTGLQGGAERHAGGDPEERSGQRAAQQQLPRRQLRFGDAGLDHGGHDIRGFQ
jgi:hypothetical protein